MTRAHYGTEQYFCAVHWFNKYSMQISLNIEHVLPLPNARAHAEVVRYKLEYCPSPV